MTGEAERRAGLDRGSPRILLVNDRGQIVNNPKGTVVWRKDDDSGKPLAGSVWHVRGGAGKVAVDVTDCVADNADGCGKDPCADQDPAPGSIHGEGADRRTSLPLPPEGGAGAVRLRDRREGARVQDRPVGRYEFSDAFVNKEFGARPLPPTGGGPARDLLLITGGLPLAGSSVSALMKRRGQRLG